MKFDYESRNYAKNMLTWLFSLESYNATKHEVGEVYHSITTNLLPLPQLMVTLTEVNGKRAVILQLPAIEGLIPEHTTFIYFPEVVEVSYHDYDEYGKYMFSARVDNKFWFYEERFQGVPAASGGVMTNFGMDMTMPFLDQQDFKVLEYIHE